MTPQSSVSVQSLCSVRPNSSSEVEEDEEDEDEEEEEEEEDGVRVERRSDGGGGSVSDSALKNDNCSLHWLVGR